MAIGLASGDVTAGAIGTVTYVDGDRIWAFGHPEDSVGRRDLLLESAYVYTVVNNPLGTQDATTYKLAAPGSPIGALTQDGVNAVGGVVGSLPPRYPLHIVAQNLDTGGRQTTNVLLADETAVGLPTGASALAQVGPLAVAQAAYTILGGAPQRVSGSMCARFSLRELPRPLRFCNTYVGGGGGDGSLAGGPLAADFAQATSAIDSFAGPRLHVTGVTVDMKLAPGLREAFLLDASAPRAIRRGHDLRVRLALERAGGGGARLTRVIRVHIPRATPTGPAQLRLRGTPADQGVTPDSSSALDLSSLLGSPSTGGPAPRTLTDLALAVAEVERYDGVIAAFQARGTSAGDALVLPAYRDPSLRISGSARLWVLIRR
jgi:hypothetical protein